MSRVHFTKEMYCYFQLLQGRSAHVWLYLRFHILFLKHENFWDSKDLNDILLPGDHIYKDLKTNVFLNADEILLLKTNLGNFLVMKKIVCI